MLRELILVLRELILALRKLHEFIVRAHTLFGIPRADRSRRADFDKLPGACLGAGACAGRRSTS